MMKQIQSEIQSQICEALPPSTQTDAGASITRRAAWLVWSGILNLAGSVLLWMVMARWREAAEVGRFTIVMSVWLIYVALCSLGLGPYLVSEITKRKRKLSTDTLSQQSFIASAAAFLILCSAIFTALMCLTGLLVSDAGEARLTIALMSLTLPPSGLLVMAEAVCIASGQTRVIAFASAAENILRTLLPLALILAGYSLPIIGLSFVGARLLAWAVYARFAPQTLSGWRLVRAEVIREVAAKTPVFAGITALSALHWQLAALLLGRLGSEEAAAHYGVASRFLVPVAVLLASYASVIQPEATRLATVSRAALGEFLSRSLRLVIVLALPFIAGTALLAQQALNWLFGAQYGDASIALGLLSASALPLGLVVIVARGLVATGHQHVDLVGNLTGVVTCFLTGLVLIPRFGATGAAAAHLVSMIALALFEIGYAARHLFSLSVGRAVLACAFPLAVMSLVVWQARVRGLWYAALPGALIYFTLLWLAQRNDRAGIETQAV